jgi:hypothetical protein
LIKADESLIKQEVLNYFLCCVVIRQSILQALAEQSRIVRLPLNQVVH